MRPPLESTATCTRLEVQPGVWLDSRLALWIAGQQLLVIADLHWGYAASHRARGHLLPVWGDDEIRTRLDSLVADYQPDEMIWVGDVVHAAEGASRAESYLREAAVPVTVLAGNHDRRWRRAAEVSAMRGRFFFHHGDALPAVPPGSVEVMGHHHPAVTWSDGAGGHVRLPALVAETHRLVLPAFSPWAAGTDCTELLTPTCTVWAISRKRIFAHPSRMGVTPVV